jgi:hypothetical protein
MVLSDDGDQTRLSDTQLVILSAAAQRADLSVLPLPDSLTLKGGAFNSCRDPGRVRAHARRRAGGRVLLRSTRLHAQRLGGGAQRPGAAAAGLAERLVGRQPRLLEPHQHELQLNPLDDLADDRQVRVDLRHRVLHPRGAAAAPLAPHLSSASLNRRAV